MGNSVSAARAIWSGLTGIGWKVKRLSTLVDARWARP